MVVSVHHAATDAGVAILKQGGNAVDAAVATGFALAVVHPVAGNLGGGGFMLVHLAKPHDGKRDLFIDFREKRPAAASRDMYLDAQHHVIPDASTLGYRSIGVPGSVAGLAYAEKKYGKLGLKAVMAPAINLAEDGFVLSGEEAAELHDPDLARFPESHRIFQTTRSGAPTTNPATPSVSPSSPPPSSASPPIPTTSTTAKWRSKLAADMKAHGGLITDADLAALRGQRARPVVGHLSRLQDHHRAAAILRRHRPDRDRSTSSSGYDLAKLGGPHSRTSPPHHRSLSAAPTWTAPTTSAIPTSPACPSARCSTRATPKPGARASCPIKPTPSGPQASRRLPAAAAPTVPAGPDESTETTHYSISTPKATPSPSPPRSTTASARTSPPTASASCSTTRWTTSPPKPGVPNMYGLIQGPDNAIAPGKRPLSAMTPTIVLEGRQTCARCSAHPAARASSPPCQHLPQRGRSGLNIQQAVDAPRFHHQYLPDKLYLEAGFPADAAAKLSTMGYTLKQRRPLERRRVHRGQSENRQAGRRPGSPPALRESRRVLANHATCRFIITFRIVQRSFRFRNGLSK